MCTESDSNVCVCVWGGGGGGVEGGFHNHAFYFRPTGSSLADTTVTVSDWPCD